MPSAGTGDAPSLRSTTPTAASELAPTSQAVSTPGPRPPADVAELSERTSRSARIYAVVIKTLHFTNAYHPSSGSIRSFYHALLAAAARHRRPVRLVVPAERSSVEDLGEFARIYRVRACRSPIIDRRYRLILRYRFFFGRWGAIWNILRTERPDVVEVSDKYSLCHLGALIRRRWFAGARRPALVGLSCERMDDTVATFVSAHNMVRSFSRWYIRHL